MPPSVDYTLAPRDRITAAIWIAGSVLILGMAAFSWSGIDSDPFHSVTPFDRAPVADPRAWRALHVAANCVKPGRTVMVFAPELSKQQELYYFAVSLFPRNTPLPQSYFGWDHYLAPRAHYLIYYDMQPASSEGLRLVCEHEGVSVYERVPR